MRPDEARFPWLFLGLPVALLASLAFLSITSALFFGVTTGCLLQIAANLLSGRRTPPLMWVGAMMFFALPLGGFLHAYRELSEAQEPQTRMIPAGLFALATTIFGGIVPQSITHPEKTVNVWPDILAAWMLLSGVILVFWRALRKKPKPERTERT